MNSPMSLSERLQNLLENAVRSGDTACIHESYRQAAQKIIKDKELNVKIFVIPEPPKTPSPT